MPENRQAGLIYWRKSQVQHRNPDACTISNAPPGKALGTQQTKTRKKAQTNCSTIWFIGT
jgi:hypothetical protein